jgi:MFS family permease
MHGAALRFRWHVRSRGRSAALLGLLYGLAGTSTSAVTVALPELGAELHVTAAAAAWMVSGYTVALAVATPVHGRLADMVGIRLPLTIGIAAMALGSLLSALAPSFPVLLVARVLQGAGAAAIPVLATALISARWSGAQQGAALGRVAGVAATLSSLGPLIGGGLEALGGWRWAVALPVLGALAIPPLWRVAPAAGTGERMDPVGAVLVAIAASGLVLLIQSPSAGAVTAAVGATLLVVGAPLLGLRVRARPHGFLPREIVTNTTVLRSAVAAAAVPASWFALLLGVPLAAASWGWTPLGTGALLVPAAIVGFISPAVARALLTRLGARRSIALACPTAVIALLTAAAGTVAQAPVLLAGAVVLVSAAFGVGQPAMISAVGAAVPSAERGVALGIATLLFLIGASVGAALVGGLAEVIGVPGAFCLLVALPLAGLTTLLVGGPDRTVPVPRLTPAADQAATGQ